MVRDFRFFCNQTKNNRKCRNEKIAPFSRIHLKEEIIVQIRKKNKILFKFVKEQNID